MITRLLPLSVLLIACTPTLPGGDTTDSTGTDDVTDVADADTDTDSDSDTDAHPDGG
jgi:hypothetical protein